MIEKPKVLKCTLRVLENRSTFEMYLSTSTEDFPEMYLSTFQVLYKLYLIQMYLSTKYSCPTLTRSRVQIVPLAWEPPGGTIPDMFCGNFPEV